MQREGIEIVGQMAKGWVHGDILKVIDSSLPALMKAHPKPPVEDQDRVAKLWIRATANEGQIINYETVYYDHAGRRIGDARYHTPAELSGV